MVAHRGGGKLAPENTLSAFRPAVEEWGADMLELDVRLTRDGHVVVLHDDTVDRTTDGSGAVADMSLEQLRELGHPAPSPGLAPPTVQQLLDEAPLEFKGVSLEGEEAPLDAQLQDAAPLGFDPQTGRERGVGDGGALDEARRRVQAATMLVM